MKSAPPAWVPHTSDADTGFLPTVTTRANQQSPSMLKWPAYRRLEALTRGQKAPIAFWEWMMGWPAPGWTALEPLGTDKYREWLRKHGEDEKETT